jgi:sigma-B regulation protein RsbU (phosphoserine phosphatase)
MNTVLCGNTQSQFVTAAYVHLDAANAEMRYAAAAHPAMLLLRDGEVRAIAENGLMLGAFDTATYQMVVHALQPGDRLLLYTDGIMEAANAKQEEFGQERLCALLRDAEKLSHDGIADLILSTVQRWSATQEDDLTVLVCDYQRS